MADAHLTSRPKVERIYLAGKIAKLDWRHRLVVGLRDWVTNPEQAYNPEHAEWPILHGAIDGHDYTGPYFFEDDSAKAHSPGSHGNAIEHIENYGGHFRGKDDPLNDGWRETVAARCCVAIRRSTVLFAWIDSLTAYGTFAEVGYAAALGYVKVWVGMPESWDYRKRHHLWLLQTLGRTTTGYCVSNDPVEVFRAVVPANQQVVKYRAYIASPEWREKATAAKARVGHRCQVCNRDDLVLDAHHRTYERLGRELPTDITVLCRRCHELYETQRKQAG